VTKIITSKGTDIFPQNGVRRRDGVVEWAM